MDVPQDWKRSAEAILENAWRKILIIGAVDRGKSTYVSFLSRRLVEEEHRVAIVDADVGQKDIGPPATITLGYPEPPFDLIAVKPAGFYFVGSVTPEGHLLPMVVGTARLAESARAVSFVIVNTTGLIHGLGRVLKSYKIEALRPEAVAAIQQDGEAESILKAHRNERIIRLEPALRVTPKTVEDRRRAREAAFRRYFQPASEITLKLGTVVFQRSLLFTGTPSEDDRCRYSERTSEGVISVAQRDTRRPNQIHIREGFERNLLCGLADPRGDGLGLGIIRKIDFSEKGITLLTPVPAERIRVIQFGDLYLTPEGVELRRRRSGEFP